MDTSGTTKFLSTSTKRSRLDLSTTAFGRVVIVICFMVVLLLTSGTYSGWQGFVSILERNQVYHWLCPVSEGYEICPDQKVAIQLLFSIASSGQNLCHSLAALLKDVIGFRKIGIIGTSLVAIGYLMLSISSENLQLYIPAFLFIGASGDFLYYASLSSLQILSNVTGFISGLLLGSSIFSWLMPVIFDAIDKNSSFGIDKIFRTYSLAICIPLSVLFCILLPKFQFQYAILKQNKTLQNENYEIEYETFDKNYIQHNDDNQNRTSHDLENGANSISSTHGYSSNSITSEITYKQDSEYSNHKETNGVISLKLRLDQTENTIETKWTIAKDLIGAIKSRHFFMFTILWAMNSLRYSFFQIASREIYGLEYSLKLAYLTPILAFFGCMGHGILIDKFGFYQGVYIFNFLHLILQSSLFLTSVYNYTFLKWIGIFLFPLCLGNILFLMSFTRAYYKHVKFFALLNGLCLIIAAIISYISAGLFSLTVQLLDGDFKYVTLSISLVTFFLFPYILAMQYFNTNTLPFKGNYPLDKR